MISGQRPRLILASASPRRHQLLAESGYAFEVVLPQVREVSSASLTLHEATSWNALRKGLAVARAQPDAVVLSADTLVALGSRVIGKPTSHDEAFDILRLLSAQTHYVSSAIFIAHLRARRSQTFCITSQVTFKQLSDELIEDYLARINPLDKAGAYAAQGLGGAIIDRIAGSRSNVIGLPLEETCAALGRFGVRRTTT